MILCIDALDALSSSFLCALLTSQITGTARERLKVLANQVGAAVLGLEAGQLQELHVKTTPSLVLQILPLSNICLDLQY